MHYLYFVKLAQAKNSEEARQKADMILGRNNFVGDGGYWSGSKADWFVIGGRWSGCLQHPLLKQDFFKEVRERIENTSKWGLTNEDVKKHKDKLQEIWLELGGKGLNPYARDNYKSDGYEDDAVKVDKELAEKIKKYKGWEDVEVAIIEEDDCVDDEAKLKDIPKKELVGSWLVVIDYHN